MKYENPAPTYWCLNDDSECGFPDLSETASEYAETLVPLEIEGVAIVERKWAVRHPINDDGETEIQYFDSRAEAEAFVAEFQAAAPAP
jgi:hypothetical protein